jgi:hypothetical protein
LALGKSVRELRQSMSSRELSRWLAYDQLDGVPDAIHIGGVIASTIYNVMTTGNTKKTADDPIFTGRRLRKPRIVSGESGRAIFRGASVMQEIREDRK